MPATVALVADDLTGAADAAAGFLRAAFGPIVTWAEPDFDSRLLHETDALAIDLRSRVLAPHLAAAVTSATVRTLFDAGVTTLYKKIDSTLRGHIGIEIRAAVMAWRPGSLAIVAPAFPAMGRVTIDGRVRVNGVLLDRPAIAAPLQEAGLRTRQVAIPAIRDGNLAMILKESQSHGIEAVVCDAEIDEDLAAIADAGIDLGTQAVWVGSSGLAHALAANLIPTHARSPAALVQRRGGILIVVGSATDIAAEQVANLQASGVIAVEVPASSLERRDGNARTTLGRRIGDGLRRGDVVVRLTSESPERDRRELAKYLGDVLEPCVSLAAALIVTGGETATHVLRAWGISALHLMEEIEAGVPLSIGIGTRSVAVVTKAGAFGDAGTLTRARARLREMQIGHTT